MTFVWVMSLELLEIALPLGIDLWAAAKAFSFPWATLGINVVGSSLAGLVLSYATLREGISEPIKLVLIVGFCGGVTTFSGFSLQLLQQLQEARYFALLLYGLGSPLLCLFSGWLAWKLTH